MLFALEIVVEAGEGYACGAADIAHGGAFEALLGEDLGRCTKDVLELGFGVAGNGSG